MTRSQALFDCAKDLFVEAKSAKRSSAILLLAASPTGSPSWRTGPRAPGCTCRRRPGALLSSTTELSHRVSTAVSDERTVTVVSAHNDERSRRPQRNPPGKAAG